jgi:hypothetical protein
MNRVEIKTRYTADGKLRYYAAVVNKHGRPIQEVQERENVKEAEQDAVILAYLLVKKDAK